MSEFSNIYLMELKSLSNSFYSIRLDESFSFRILLLLFLNLFHCMILISTKHLQEEEVKQLKESYNKERRRQLESLENRESDLMSQFRLHLSNAKKSLSDKIDRLQKKNNKVISSYIISFVLYCTTHH